MKGLDLFESHFGFSQTIDVVESVNVLTFPQGVVQIAKQDHTFFSSEIL